MNIWQYIAVENPAAADRLYARLAHRMRLLEARPRAGRPRPEISPEARSLVEPPYVIFYRIVADGVQIVRVLHGRRRFDRALFEQGTA
jgi:toxin ParE1/3/4